MNNNHAVQIAAEAAQRQLLEAEMTRVLHGLVVLSTALGRCKRCIASSPLSTNPTVTPRSRCDPPRGEAVALTEETFFHISSASARGAAGRTPDPNLHQRFACISTPCSAALVTATPVAHITRVTSSADGAGAHGGVALVCRCTLPHPDTGNKLAHQVHVAGGSPASTIPLAVPCYDFASLEVRSLKASLHVALADQPEASCIRIFFLFWQQRFARTRLERKQIQTTAAAGTSQSPTSKLKTPYEGSSLLFDSDPFADAPSVRSRCPFATASLTLRFKCPIVA